MEVTVIGGGTGIPKVIKGLRNNNPEISINSIITVFDSGGSSGRLREDYSVLPYGDIRNTLISLGDNDKVKDMFAYRFESGELKGHNMGNLILTFLEKMHGSGLSAIEEAAELIGAKGRVIPVSEDKAHLHAELENGSIIKGETNIDIPKHDAGLRINRVFLEPEATATPQAINSINNSNFVIVGPGDIYTSIIPNFLAKNLSEAIKDSNSKIIYVCNTMTKRGETHDFKASDFVREIESYMGKKVDYVVVNSKLPEGEKIEKIREKNPNAVEIDGDLGTGDTRVIEADVIDDNDPTKHDPRKLGTVLTKIIMGEMR